MTFEGLLCSFISSRCIYFVNQVMDSHIGCFNCLNQMPGPERKKKNDSIALCDNFWLNTAYIQSYSLPRGCLDVGLVTWQ